MRKGEAKPEKPKVKKRKVIMIKLKFVAVLFWVTLTCDPIAASAQQHEDDSIHNPAEILAEFEAEADRRRSEEGENFDEEAYQFERGMMDGRSQLDEKRIAIEEEFQQKREQLQNSGGGQNPNAWQELDEAQQQRHDELQEQYQALDRESQDYWNNRQREEMGNQREEFISAKSLRRKRIVVAEFEAEADRRRSEERESEDDEEHVHIGDEDLDIDEVREAVAEMGTRFAGTRDMFRSLEKAVVAEYEDECDDCIEKSLQRFQRYAEMRRLNDEERDAFLAVADLFVAALHQAPASGEDDRIGWADQAFQLRGSQKDYDRVMEADDPESEFRAIEEGDEVAEVRDRIGWADQAFQLRGSQEDYDRVMEADDPESEFRAIEESDELEFRGGEVPTIETQLSTDDSPILIDFDPDEGDQQQRRAIVEDAGDEVELQLCAVDVPEIYGWSVLIEYDSDQVRYVSNSFQSSDFVPNFFPLVDERDASVEVGGANFSKETASGNGDLGTLRFAVLDGFKGETGLKVTRFNRRTLTSTEVISVETVALITNQEALEDAGHLDDHGELVEGFESLSADFNCSRDAKGFGGMADPCAWKCARPSMSETWFTDSDDPDRGCATGNFANLGWTAITNNESWCVNETGSCKNFMTRMYTNPVSPGPAEAWVNIWCPGECSSPNPLSPDQLLTSLSQCVCP